MNKPVILASQSARRKELLSAMGLPFTVVPPRVEDEEAFIDRNSLEESLIDLARAKAGSVSASHPDALILGCDTLVVTDSHILGKPRTRDDARRMIEQLSGKGHRVLSGVALLHPANGFSAGTTVSTQVFFRQLTPEEIEWYLDKKEFEDKAGGYGIQQSAMVFVESIKGCYYNVVGLPIAATIDLFNRYLSEKAR